MHLYVMRHGPAEDRAPSGRDADRRLTPEGRERVQRVANELRRVRGGAPLARVLASPLARARETAEIAAPICGAPEVELQDELALDAGLPLALVAALARGGADALLVGHQPNVEHLVRTLIDPPGRGATGLLLSSFTTALIVALEPEPTSQSQGRWRVERIFDPRALA
ncbi:MULTISPECIES: phosphohistidine phosphatase SixA [Sorangium]|uniref:Phosphohistidine phosphatase n=1 Tax=Sorangium cellulosum TaxID=56 RepID=A0A150QP89_SORCE|nr:phosphohistidine phosphatase SixA [Sorangium cellulosum]KYF69793.1 phosphohistidine phosphatase [Sorangium cellulosum]